MALENFMSVTSASEKTGTSHVLFFDTIRGLAALAVLANHYVHAYGLPSQSKLWHHLWTYTPLNIWWDGQGAVSLFFVLSGLVLSLKYFRTTHTPSLAAFDLRHYFVARFCRIWLPYFVVLVVSAVLQKTVRTHYDTRALPPTEWIAKYWQTPISIKNFIQQSILFLRYPFTLIPQAWTLCTEICLSFLIPIGIMVAARSSYWLIFFTVFAISTVGASHFLLHFTLGVLMAKHFSQTQQLMKTQPLVRYGALFCGVIFYTATETFPVWFQSLFHYSINGVLVAEITGVGASFILMFVMGSLKTQELLSIRCLRVIGKISYSIYLIHLIVLLCITPIFLQLFDKFSMQYLFVWFAGLAFTVGVTTSLSMLSYRFIEIPAIALGKRLAMRSSTVRIG